MFLLGLGSGYVQPSPTQAAMGGLSSATFSVHAYSPPVALTPAQQAAKVKAQVK